MTLLFRGSAFAAAITFSAALAPGARAQIPVIEAQDPDALVPPHLLESIIPAYPEAARSEGLEADVPVRLSIDEQGVVTGAEVLAPAGHGFDEAARDAALKLRFAPATRGGKPIPARIRHVFHFAPSVAVEPATAPVPSAEALASEPAPPPPPAPAPPAAPSPTRETAVDVNVQGRLTDAQKLQQSAEAVAVVDLRRANEQSADMGEVLARTQGVVVRRDGGLGSGARICMNGLCDDQVRRFIDGVPMDFSAYTGVTALPLNLFERIELYRGVVPIRFGADALGGAINFVTDESYATHAGASYQVGSFGTHRVAANGRYRHSPTGFVAGGTAFFDAAKNDFKVDVEIPDERGRLSPARVSRFHDGYRAYGGTVEAGLVDKKYAKLLLLRGFFGRAEKELQHNVVMTVPYGEVQYGTTAYGATARWAVELPRGVTVDVVGAYSKRTTRFEDHSQWVYNWRGERIRERRIYGEIEAPPTDQLHWQHAVFGRALAKWQVAKGHTITASSAANYYTRTGDERLQVDASARDPLTADRKMLTLVSGAEYEVSLHSDKISNILFFKDYVYRAQSEEPLPGGVFKERDTKQHRLGIGDGLRVRITDYLYAKASYELATRLPRPDEVFGDGVLVRPNLDLRAELSHNANLGPRLELPRTPAGAFVAELNAFYRDSDQLIVLLGNDRFFTYQNVFRARSLGLENTLSWSSPGRYVNVDGGLTWVDQRNASSEGTFGDFEGDRIPNRPYLMGSWAGRLRFGGFPDADDTLEPYYYGRYVHSFFRGWESQGLREYKQVVDAQITHSVGVTWALSEMFGRLTTSAEVDNVTDARVFDNFGVERPGRAFYLKVSGAI